MMTNQDHQTLIFGWCARLSHGAGMLAGVMGMVVLIGWGLDIALLKSLLPGLVTMKANTAGGFLLAGLALVFLQEGRVDPRQHRWATILAASVALLGLLTVSEYLFGWDLGIDQLLFKESAGAIGTRFPGRMGLNTALNFALAGAALLLLDRHTDNAAWKPAESLALIVFLMALMALLGYGYGIKTLAGSVGSYTTMALHTALGFVTLSVGILLARPTVGMMATLTSTRAGGAVGRRLLPLIVAMPAVLGWLCLTGARAGNYDTEYSLVLLVLLNSIGFTLLLWPNLRSINQAVEERQAVEEALRRSGDELTQGAETLVATSAGILATVSQVAAGAAEIVTAVSETGTTAEEVKQTAHLSHQKARQVQDSAQKAVAVSETGRQAVTEVIEGMNHIRERMGEIAESVVRLSEQGQAIGEIIAVVNDLAEQSNLLAVNAAIEASRAGVHGKGFVVLAHEVKSLAGQSRLATTQVRAILIAVQKATSAAVTATEQGTQAVAAGVTQASQADVSIRTLAGSVGEAAQAATQIAASNQQQLVGMDQIAVAIANIRQATRQNLAGSQQLETSARELQAFGERLKGLVRRQRGES